MPPSAFVVIDSNAASICSKLNSWVVIDEGSTRPFSMSAPVLDERARSR
jgi:hypothetical protein